MNALDGLIACEGDWTGTNDLQDPEYDSASTSASRATVTSLMEGLFVRIDYTWTYREKPQWGSLLVGFHPEPAEATVVGIDSWHNGRSSMMCRGSRRDDGVLDVRGSYGAGDGPDWGWRTEIRPDADALRWVMYNVTPAGEEVLAVEETLRRV